jgi:hypothetical protein
VVNLVLICPVCILKLRNLSETNSNVLGSIINVLGANLPKPQSPCGQGLLCHLDVNYSCRLYWNTNIEYTTEEKYFGVITARLVAKCRHQVYSRIAKCMFKILTLENRRQLTDLVGPIPPQNFK